MLTKVNVVLCKDTTHSFHIR